MFIPNISFKKDLEIGEVVVLKKDYMFSYGIFTTGHEFTIMRNDGDHHGGKYTIKDNELGITLTKVGQDYLRRILDPKTCKSIYDKRKYDAKIISTIHFICTHQRTSHWDRYSEYTSCAKKDKRVNRNDVCSPCLECLKHLDPESLKEEPILLGALRQTKLKNIMDRLSQK